MFALVNNTLAGFNVVDTNNEPLCCIPDTATPFNF